MLVLCISDRSVCVHATDVLTSSVEVAIVFYTQRL